MKKPVIIKLTSLFQNHMNKRESLRSTSLYIYNQMVVLCVAVRGEKLALSSCSVWQTVAGLQLAVCAQTHRRKHPTGWSWEDTPPSLLHRRAHTASFVSPWWEDHPHEWEETLFLCPFSYRQSILETVGQHGLATFLGGKNLSRVRRTGSVSNTRSRILFNGSQRSGRTVGIKLHLSPLHSADFFPAWVLWFTWRGKWSLQCFMPFWLF